MSGVTDAVREPDDPRVGVGDVASGQSASPGAADPVPVGRAPVDVEHVGLMTSAVRFVGTGLMTATVDFGLLLILMAVGVSYTPAKVVSFIVGSVTAYALNRRFTFKAKPSTRRFLLTMLAYVVSFVVQVGIFTRLFPLLTADHLPQFVVQAVSFVCGQGAATVANFSIQRWLIFRPTRRADSRLRPPAQE